MQKLLIVASLILSMAPVSHAQSFIPEFGTGNVLCKNRVAVLQRVAAVDHRGLDAFAMVPYGHVCDSPASTGGGSLGYNQMLKNF